MIVLILIVLHFCNFEGWLLLLRRLIRHQIKNILMTVPLQDVISVFLEKTPQLSFDFIHQNLRTQFITKLLNIDFQLLHLDLHRVSNRKFS